MTAATDREQNERPAGEPLEVQGPRLALRYATLEDAPALFELGRDPAVTRFFSWGPYERVAQAEAYIGGLAVKRDRGEQLDFVVVDPDEGVIGVTGLSELSKRDRRAVVGTWFGHRFWGGGANVESKALVAALAFGHLGLERLTAMASTLNERSHAALERIGFEREGVLAQWHRHGDEVHDLVVYALLRGAWERSELARVPVTVRGEPPSAFVV